MVWKSAEKEKQQQLEVKRKQNWKTDNLVSRLTQLCCVCSDLGLYLLLYVFVGVLTCAPFASQREFSVSACEKR